MATSLLSQANRAVQRAESQARSAAISAETAAEHIRNALQILSSGQALDLRGTYLAIERDDVAAIRERLTTALAKIECAHRDIVVYRSIRDLSDTETTYGQCRACQAWAVSTITMSGAGGHENTRLMTATERERLQAHLDRYRRADQ